MSQTKKNDHTHSISQIAHDLRSPLTVIKTYLQHAPLPQDPELCELHAATLRSLEKISGMIESLRGGPKQTHHRECSDVAELLQSSVKEFASVAREAGVMVEYIGPLSCMACVNTQLLDRAVTNLVRNAVQATPSGKGRVVVHLFTRDENVFVEVIDNGKGIPPEHLSSLFTRGFTHGKADGTGLGLDLCKTVVENHGGSLCVSSRPNEGTIFTTMLPFHALSLPEMTLLD